MLITTYCISFFLGTINYFNLSAAKFSIILQDMFLHLVSPELYLLQIWSLWLKEIHIRGQIYTNVDYTLDLLHVNFKHICYDISRKNDDRKLKSRIQLTLTNFLQALKTTVNKIPRFWLDGRIAMRVRIERPPWYLSVVGGALFVSATILTM